MPTTKAKNLVYRLALPLFSPAVPGLSKTDLKGISLSQPDSLFTVFRRNHISGGALYLE